jgi:hypothetical protein
MRISISLAAVILSLASAVHGVEQKHVSKVFSYTASKLGIPILRAAMRVENGFSEAGTPIYQVSASVDSLSYLGVFFRMNNHFTSILKGETLLPLRYVKTIDQEGLLIHKKHYVQTLTFDQSGKKIVMEKAEKETQEIPLPPDTYDPLSMFARYYLKEELRPGQQIRMSVYDGVKLRQMVFLSRREKVRSKLYGEIEAVCLESTTSFSTFGEKEGTIRIWYTTDGTKTPISMELDLPIGNIKFELDDIKNINDQLSLMNDQ